MSYSEPDRQRFITWLKTKYGTVGNLNKAWATERWSRRLNSSEDVDLPLASGPGPAERYLDLHRYWSDVTVRRLRELDIIRRRNMPDVPSISKMRQAAVINTYAPKRNGAVNFWRTANTSRYASVASRGLPRPSRPPRGPR